MRQPQQRGSGCHRKGCRSRLDAEVLEFALFLVVAVFIIRPFWCGNVSPLDGKRQTRVWTPAPALPRSSNGSFLRPPWLRKWSHRGWERAASCFGIFVLTSTAAPSAAESFASAENATLPPPPSFPVRSTRWGPGGCFCPPALMRNFTLSWPICWISSVRSAPPPAPLRSPRPLPPAARRRRRVLVKQIRWAFG